MELMDTSQLILDIAKRHFDPVGFHKFSDRFCELHREPRVSNWNTTVLEMLHSMKISETLSKLFSRYVLSLGVRMSDELYFVTNACQLLSFIDYPFVLITSFRLLREPYDEQRKLRLWFDVLKTICHVRLMMQLFLRMSLAAFPACCKERLEFLVELRQNMQDDMFFQLVKLGGFFESSLRGSLHKADQVEYLRFVVDTFLSNNPYLMNRFLVLTTGGEMVISPQRTCKDLQSMRCGHENHKRLVYPEMKRFKK